MNAVLKTARKILSNRAGSTRSIPAKTFADDRINEEVGNISGMIESGLISYEEFELDPKTFIDVKRLRNRMFVPAVIKRIRNKYSQQSGAEDGQRANIDYEKYLEGQTDFEINKSDIEKISQAAKEAFKKPRAQGGKYEPDTMEYTGLIGTYQLLYFALLKGAKKIRFILDMDAVRYAGMVAAIHFLFKDKKITYTAAAFAGSDLLYRVSKKLFI